jgi:multisubunit Na+/H+ antiporter MnhC subunit
MPPTPRAPRGLNPLVFVMVLTAVAVGFAAMIALWMYWLAGSF